LFASDNVVMTSVTRAKVN